MSPQQRETQLVRYRERLLRLDAAHTLTFRTLSDYDQSYVLKTEKA